MSENIQSILKDFFKQVETGDHSTSNFPATYDALELKVGFGLGNDALIPWLVFLGTDQLPQYGIFPALYYFKTHHKLILAYGISEKRRPVLSWRAPLKVQTISQYFQTKNIRPHKYGLSYVYKVYTIIGDINYEQIQIDLDKLIAHYKTLFACDRCGN